MSKNHSHNHSTENLRLVFFLNIGFAVFELIGGLLTNSIAIISDALHDLGDSISIGAAWFLENFSKKKSDKKYSYGYGRFSLLGALLNAIILLAGSIFILSETIPRLLNPEPSNAQGMIFLAIIGVIVNGYAVTRLRKDESFNAKVIALHLMEDVLGWAAILIVGITLLFSDLYILDPILSILIIIYILFNVAGNLKKTASLFLQASPDHINIEAIESKFNLIDKVISSHHTHVWSLDGANHILTTHLIVKSGITREDIIKIKSKCNQMFEDLKLNHITIEIEFEDEVCLMDVK
jgi:cobalt-zinc-cadmium efflux system protein